MKKVSLLISPLYMCLASFMSLSYSQNIIYGFNKENTKDYGEQKINKLKYNFVFLSAYQKEEYESKSKNENYIWYHNENIYEDDKYKINIDSINDKKIYVDFFSKNVSRYYLIEFNFFCDIMSNEKEIINYIIIKETKHNYENNMISRYSLNNNEVWIPFSSSKKTISIINDAYTSFRSSWGVVNSSTKILNFDFNISEKLIRESLLSEKHINDDRIVIESLKIKDLYYLPLIEVIKTPIWHSWFWQDNIKLNNTNIFNDIQDFKYNLILPEGSSSGQEWWHGLISAIGLGTFVSQLVLLFCSGSSSMLISNASYNALKWLSNGRFGLSLVWGFIKEYYENNLETNIDETMENVKKLGIKTTINKEININNENKLSVSGKVKYDAKATNIFGRQSKAKIKDIVGISDVDITWNEYKEFNNVEKI